MNNSIKYYIFYLSFNHQLGWHRGKSLLASHLLTSGDRSSPDAHFNLYFLFFVFCFRSRNMHHSITTLLHEHCLQFFNTDKFDCYIDFIIIFNSMIHYHKPHSSNSSQAYLSQLSDFQCCLPRYTKAAGSNKLKSAWGKPSLILLGHKLFVCFPIEIMSIVQHS